MNKNLFSTNILFLINSIILYKIWGVLGRSIYYLNIVFTITQILQALYMKISVYDSTIHVYLPIHVY